MNHLPNLLQKDGETLYLHSFLSNTEASDLMRSLLGEIPWQHDELRFFGKTIRTARKAAWFADAAIPYSYSGTTKTAHPWTPSLLAIKGRTEALCGCKFNACLANFYENGSQGMSWHSDDEKSIQPDSAIASVSLGAERKFRFKHKREALLRELQLEHGSLLLMRGTTQSHWLHCLPKSKKIAEPRINLTFRQMRTV